MNLTLSSNTKPRFLHLPHKITLRSDSQLQHLNIKRCHPATIEFKFDDMDSINKATFKKVALSLSKRVSKLKNPPVKELLKHKGLVKNLKGLQIKPEDAAKYITKITKRFTRLLNFAILDEKDSFSPMRLKKKVYAMRLLKTFTYDHEFCQDFMKCARYVKTMKIRKTSLNFNHLKRLQHLQNLYIILKTKYVTLPDEDKKYTTELGKVLTRLPVLNKVVLEQEMDPETNPYLFLELNKVLKDKAKVSLVADFVDVSNQRNKDNSVEKTLQTILSLGVNDLKVNYVGVVKAMKRFGRSFYAPVHVRKELYIRFIRAIMDIPFDHVHFMPTVHSSYIDSELKNAFLDLIKPSSKLRIPGLSIIYHLDLIEPATFDLLLDLYNYAIPSYELVITSTNNLRKGLIEQLEDHYSQVLGKVQKSKAEFSLQITARNLSTLTTLIQIITPKVNLSLLKSLNIQIIEPVTKPNLKSLYKLLKKSFICNVIKKLDINVSQKEAPKFEDLFEPLNLIAQASPKLKKLEFSYFNTLECREPLKQTFEELRKNHFRIDCNYEINRERANFE